MSSQSPNPEGNTANTTGKYVINRTLSTPHDDVLAAQGVSWLQRTAISIATVTLDLNHTFDVASQTETIKFQHTATGGIKGTSGIYHFPSTDLKHSDHVFGAVLITAERKPLSEITHPFLREGWDAGVETSPLENVKGVLWTYTVPDKSQRSDQWSAEQVWGYATHDIGGTRERRYTRRIHFTSPSLTKDVLLVYENKDIPSSITASASTDDSEDLASFGGS